MINRMTAWYILAFGGWGSFDPFDPAKVCLVDKTARGDTALFKGVQHWGGTFNTLSSDQNSR